MMYPLWISPISQASQDVSTWLTKEALDKQKKKWRDKGETPRATATRKRSSDDAQVDISSQKETNQTVKIEGKNSEVGLLEGGSSRKDEVGQLVLAQAGTPPPPQYVSPWERKRNRREEGKSHRVWSTEKTEAGSGAEYRPKQ